MKMFKRIMQCMVLLVLLFVFSSFLSGSAPFVVQTDPAVYLKYIDAVLPRIRRIVFLNDSVNDALRDRKRYTRIEEISPDLKHAILSIEDNRFYDHIGIDPAAVARAMLVNLQYGRIEEGASTITQQLAKNLFLSGDQTMERKAEELLLSLDLELRYDKDEILELYLNSIYFGTGFYGIGDASYGYFGKAPGELNLAESAMLAGVPNAPSVYSPFVDFMLSKKRQFIVLDAMVRSGYITEREAESAKIESLDFVGTEAAPIPGSVSTAQ
ncbi:hypothetical protein TAMA11512_09560 [Selenomonas sp. TAMA-11512]|uniref:transglycosylase domain-containing protein n=1 Tax=Selenomonas sp. TAMA-11512 TaxID=3095337 RepID=UPI003087DDDD|nr:hypothetical protein TAMA11512_09560 [Selenomonas sp. TAMA-11512]